MHNAFGISYIATIFLPPKCDFESDKEACLGMHDSPVNYVEYSHALSELNISDFYYDFFGEVVLEFGYIIHEWTI